MQVFDSTAGPPTIHPTFIADPEAELQSAEQRSGDTDISIAAGALTLFAKIKHVVIRGKTNQIGSACPDLDRLRALNAALIRQSMVARLVQPPPCYLSSLTQAVRIQQGTD